MTCIVYMRGLGLSTPHLVSKSSLRTLRCFLCSWNSRSCFVRIDWGRLDRASEMISTRVRSIPLIFPPRMLVRLGHWQHLSWDGCSSNTLLQFLHLITNISNHSFQFFKFFVYILMMKPKWFLNQFIKFFSFHSIRNTNGRYWDRTSDLPLVRRPLYRWVNRPFQQTHYNESFSLSQVLNF